MADVCAEDISEEIKKSESDTNLVNGNLNEIKDEQNDCKDDKKGLNRSVSCGSILQGTGMSKMKNLSRRVSFPSDDKLISGYNEPRNPWEHAHNTTTEDLIQAYTEACQSWNVKPITKLLLQLQEIRDFTVRANSLTLKGEKLEMRVVETLESIFKRVQFVTIDLEATNLDEDAGASLFDMIEFYESAVNVLVGFNKNLGNRGWQAAAHMMRKMSCLRLFDGHSVPLSNQAAPFVGRALRLSNTLVTLHLENALLSGRPLLLIVAALRMNTTLRELFLADNRFNVMDALQIANLLKFNRILQLLDLRNNPIQDIGLGHLCAGLISQAASTGLNGPTGGLQTLVLWNNQITHAGMAKLESALKQTISLATLNLGQNTIGDDGMLRLKEGLLQNHSLLRLGLVGTKLTDEGAVAVAEYLAESTRIIRLDLRNNDIKVAGLMALSLAFKINDSLLRLDIDKPNKKDALKELAAKQESLLSNMVAYAARNKEAAALKAQATATRMEEARRAAEREKTEIRYMDMTNTSAASNNSNNQPRIQETSKPVADGNDDTPEDSPEFLPRVSVSYHQDVPVMLSNYELSKRAAEARLQPLREEQKLPEPPGPCRFQIQPVLNPESAENRTKFETRTENSSDFCVGEPGDSKSTPEQTEAEILTQSSSDSSIGVTEDSKSTQERTKIEISTGNSSGDYDSTREHTKTVISTGNSSDSSIGAPRDSESSGVDKQTLQTKDVSSFYGSRERFENLQILAERLTNTVLSFGAEEMSADESITKEEFSDSEKTDAVRIKSSNQDTSSSERTEESRTDLEASNFTKFPDDDNKAKDIPKGFQDFEITDSGLKESLSDHHSDQTSVLRTSEESKTDLEASKLPNLDTHHKDQDTEKGQDNFDSNTFNSNENESRQNFVNEIAPVLGEIEEKTKSSSICGSKSETSNLEASQLPKVLDDDARVDYCDNGGQDSTESKENCDSNNSTTVENESKQGFVTEITPILGEIEENTKSSSICESGFETSDLEVSQLPKVSDDDAGVDTHDNEDQRTEKDENNCDSNNSATVENQPEQGFENKVTPVSGEIDEKTNSSSICESGFETSDDTLMEMSPVEILPSILQTRSEQNQVLTPDSGLVHFEQEQGGLESGDNCKFEFLDRTNVDDSYSDQTSVD